jgi:error-prone DNA polymerase
VRVGGLVVARQRPGTANGIVFVLLEDEFGTVNLIVPAQLYERHRLIVRTEPLMLAEGKLERLPAAGGAISVLVDRVASIAAPDRPPAEVTELPSGEAEDFRAVAPPVMSFASGRRR